MSKRLWIIMALGTLPAFAPARAQTFAPGYPVCMRLYSGANGGGGEWNDCSFTTMAQCAASASGRPATCLLNPYYAYNEQPPARRQYKRAY